MVRKCRPETCSVFAGKRFSRLVYGIALLLISWWLWSFIVINNFSGMFFFYLFIPLYLGFLFLYEGILGFCFFWGCRSMKKRDDRIIGYLVHAISIVSSAIVTVVVFFLP
jgi:hypothetical protein